MMRHREPAVRGYAVTHPVGDVSLPTQAGWNQLIYAKSGAFSARTDLSSFTVPPHCAIWLGGGVPVRLATRRPAAIRCLYLQSRLGAPAEPVRVIGLGKLTRELLLHAVESSPLDLGEPVDAAIVTLLLHRLAAEPSESLRLPLPRDDRALVLAEELIADPAPALASVVESVGASRRTLERIFRSETQLTLAAWQRRARVMRAVELMAQDHNVTEAGLSVGYSTASSFVAAFRFELGSTPRGFMQARQMRDDSVVSGERTS